LFKKKKNLLLSPVISSQKVAKPDALCQFCCKKEVMHMRRKRSSPDEMSLLSGLEKGRMPYRVDNMFYETFGMSYDEVLESLCADSIDIMTSFY
jgi:hypothetical protein